MGDSPEEKERIESSGGHVKSQVYPGLSMTRTFGDQSVKNHGVTAVPEIVESKVNPEDKPFVLLASDGLWEFLTADFVAKGVAKKIESEGMTEAVTRLSKESRKRWRLEEGDYCDDITVVFASLFP